MFGFHFLDQKSARVWPKPRYGDFALDIPLLEELRSSKVRTNQKLDKKRKKNTSCNKHTQKMSILKFFNLRFSPLYGQNASFFGGAVPLVVSFFWLKQ